MCPIISTELRILLWIQEHLTHPLLDKFFIFITTLGDAGILWILIGLFFLLQKKHRSLGILMIVSLIGSLIVTNGILKNWIARPRPYTVYPLDLLIDKNPEYSFPSGHTSAAFAAAWMIYMNKKRLGIYMVTLATLMGLSRVYLFMHYPTDVIGGAVVGILIAESVYWLYDKWRIRKVISK
jgi:undecaprenyl-diphosphatase